MAKSKSKFKLVIELDAKTTENVLKGYREIALLNDAQEEEIIECLQKYFGDEFLKVISSDYHSLPHFEAYQEIITVLKEDTDYLDSNFNLENLLSSSTARSKNKKKIWLEYSDVLNIDDIVPVGIRLFPEEVDEYSLELTYKTKNIHRRALKEVIFLSAFSKIFKDLDDSDSLAWK